MPSVLFYNRCLGGGADGPFPSPSQPLTPESRIMLEMALTVLFPQRSTAPSVHPFLCAHLSQAGENTVLTVRSVTRRCTYLEAFSVIHVLVVLTLLEFS